MRKQIQKCPHCHKDAIFSHDFCPNCGFESSFEERGEPDYTLEANPSVPSYAYLLEDTLTAAQRHGRILLYTVFGLMALLPFCWGLTSFFLLFDPHRSDSIPIFRVLLVCGGILAIYWKIATGGASWLHRLLIAAAALTASAMAFSSLWVMFHLGTASQQPGHALVLSSSVVGCILYSWSAWQLSHSKDIRDFLHHQRLKKQDEQG